MTSSKILYSKLFAMRKRWLLVKAVEFALLDFFILIILSLIGLNLAKIFSKHDFFYQFLTFIPLVFVLIFSIHFFLYNRTSIMDIAFFIDRRANLKEKVSTSVEMIEKKFFSPMISALIKDAENAILQLDPSRLIPFEFSRNILYMILISALLVGLYFIPNNKDNSISSKLRELFISQGKELENYSKALSNIDEKLEYKEELVKDINQLSNKLKSGKMTKKDALLEFSTLEQKLKEQKSNLTTTELNSLKKMSLSGKNSLPQDPKKALEEIANKAQNEKLSSEDKDKLKKKFQELSKKMSDNNPCKDDIKNLVQSIDSGNSEEISKAVKSLANKIQQCEKEQENIENVIEKIKKCQKQIASEPEKGISNDMSSDMEMEKVAQYSQKEDPFSKSPTKVPIKEVKGKNGQADYGKGSTNEQQEGKQVENKSLYYNREASHTSDKSETFVRIYAEERVDTNKALTQVSGNIGEGDITYTKETRGSPVKLELAYKPYVKVFQEYKKEAEENIDNQKIPKNYKTIVKKYFEEIDPNSK